ncbi:DUF6389 family protein [Vibrio europaeus]|uniref:DUF6389 family protein n=1 Tax=Vibrio europaeus TaxID=300876 RepID=UPI00148DC68D|nr:DUF6389 family protein [Vibrio europaeus]NOH26374.1 hypothetical protein [Vibrio europaeus]
MNFEEELGSELVKHSESMATSLKALFANIPENTREIHIEVFASQDGDGMFSVYVSLDGPDLHLLNKAIERYASLFEPKYVDSTINPYIPTVDPFDVDFEVNDVVVDCVANWINSIWERPKVLASNIPVIVLGHDSFGTVTPLELG